MRRANGIASADEMEIPKSSRRKRGRQDDLRRHLHRHAPRAEINTGAGDGLEVDAYLARELSHAGSFLGPMFLTTREGMS